jgi:eukaryotic-like serine/threonine-protein kinase
MPVNEGTMSDPNLARADHKSPALEPAPGPGPGKASRKVRCRFAHGSESGPGFTDEMSCLLRIRLRLAILIALAGFALHFVRNLLWPEPAFDHRPLRLIVTGCEIVVLVIVSGVLWSRLALSMRTLRILELTIFGMIAAFFAWLQFDVYHDGALLRSIVHGQEALVFRQVGMAAALRWFLLIVLYGAFVPNTWRRCAAVVGILASIPIVLMLAGSLVDEAVGPYVLSALPEVVILMATAVAIAVFGSHKIRELQQKAHEAERLGQYRLKQVLGFGGQGAVYLAEHVLLRRPCAIKLIRPEQTGDRRSLIRFEREVQATATLTHPNTVEIFDYGHTDDGTFYYVMEYLPGMNLDDLVEQYGPMPPERAVHLLRQVCQALREAHSIGLIHRDIKPSNIFACERGKVYDVAKLLDFGLVKNFSLAGDDARLTREGSFAGSPAFMSPEQAAGRSNSTRAATSTMSALWPISSSPASYCSTADRPCKCFTLMLTNRSFPFVNSRKQRPPTCRGSFYAVWKKTRIAVTRMRRPWTGPWPPAPARADGLWKKPRPGGGKISTAPCRLRRRKHSSATA